MKKRTLLFSVLERAGLKGEKRNCRRTGLRKALKKIPTKHLRKVLETLLGVVKAVRVEESLPCTTGLL